MTDEQILEELLLRFEATQEMGLQITCGEICKDHPHLEDRLRREVELLEKLNQEVSKHDSLQAKAPAPSRGRPKQIGRYVPERTIGQGALGEVMLASDTELQRHVALKRLLAAGAGSGDGRLRFLVEAQVTGRLDHPGVVPVHGLVYDDDRNPYYAMRLIRGESLDAAIARFHREHPVGSSSPTLATDLQALLRSFLAVCQTVAYAHSQGFLHRDLKPENVMVGRYGETLVVDWGLAKRFAGSEGNSLEATTPSAPAQESALDRQLAALDKTMEGHRKGSPAYMSPEQAAGRWSEVGPASDVYSLGATLYKLLTGQLPFRDPKTVFQQIARGEYPRPREQRADVSFGLEAICLKAMALRPDDRYATAQDLAADIERWLADEPVLALPEPLSLQAARWVKRNQSYILTGTVGSIIAIVALIALVVQQNNANAEIAGQKKKAEDHLTVAEKNLRLARHNLYLARMNLAARAVADDWTTRASELLDAERPRPGETEDRRQLEWHYLWNALHRSGEKVPFDSKTTSILALAADGQRMAVVEKDRLAIREIGRKDPKFVSAAKLESNDHFKISPDFRWGVIGRDDHLELWSLQGKATEPAQTITFAEGEEFAVMEFSSDSSMLAVLSAQGSVDIWEIATKKKAHSFAELKNDEAKPPQKLEGWTHYRALAFSHDGTRLAGIRTNANGVSIAATWSLADKKKLYSEASELPLTGISWAGEKTIVVRLAVDQLEFIELGGNGRPWLRCPDPMAGYSFTEHAISEDSTLFFIPWIGLRIVELRETGDVRSQMFPGTELTIGIPSMDGRRVLIASEEDRAELWNIDQLWEPAILDGEFNQIESLAWSGDSQHFYALGEAKPKPGAPSAADDSHVVSFHREGRVVEHYRTKHAPYFRSATAPQRLMVHEGRIAALSGPTIACFDAATGESLGSPAYDTKPEVDLLIFQGPPAIRPLALARGEKRGEVVVVETRPNQEGVRLRRWNAEQGEWRGGEVLLPIKGLIETVVISPDGRWGIIGVDDNGGQQLSVWPLDAGKDAKLTLQLPARVSSAVFSSDATLFAAATQEGQVHVWQTKDWKLDRVFTSASQNVQAMAFWPGERRLLAGDYTGQILLWDMDEEIQRYSWHPGFPITALAIAPDGSRFAAGGEHGELRVYHFPKPAEILPRSIRHAAAEPANPAVQRELVLDAWSAYLDAKARNDAANEKDALATGRGALESLSRLRELTSEEAAWVKAFQEARDSNLEPK